MSDYAVTVARSAERELRRLDPAVLRRVIAAIETLASDPRPPGAVKLTGTASSWRVRVGDWRVLYTVDDSRRTVDVAAVRHRSDAYR